VRHQHLLLHVLLDVLRADFGTVDVAQRIGRNTLGATSNGGAWRRGGNEGRYRTIPGAADPNGTLPPRIVPVTLLIGRLGVGHIQDILLVDIDSAGPAELLPFSEEIAFLIENLDAVVTAVGHEKTSFGVESEGVGHFKLPWSGSVSAPLL